jgi:exonuclease SbcC
MVELREIEKQRNDAQRQLDAARAELRNEISGYEATIAGLERTLRAALPDALENVRVEIAGLEALDGERAALDGELQALRNENTSLEATNNTLRPEMTRLKERIDRLKAAEGAECPLCGQPLTEAHKLKMLAELEGEGKVHGDTFRSNQTRMKLIVDETRTRQDALTDIRVKLQRLADLQKREGELSSGVKKAQEAELQLDEERANLDAVRATLEGEAFAGDLRAQIAAMDEERAALGYDGDLHSAAREGLKRFSEFEARQKDLQVALEALPDAALALEGAAARQERLLRAQTEEGEALEQNAQEILRLDVLVREEQARRAEVNHQRMAHDSAYRKLINAQQDLKAIENGRIRKADLEVKLAERKVERTVYDELRLAFSKNGIPAMIIETAIPELEAGANRLLNRMTDGRMSLMLTTQREKVTGGVAETLDIQVADELGTRAYDLFSGGEAFRINFALRVALSQLLARRAGAQLRTLFIDEGFGTQDEEGRNKLVEAITAIQEDFSLILVITHIEDLRDSFPVHVMVEKLGDGSRISVR